MNSLNVLIVSAEQDTQASLAGLLARCGLDTTAVSTVKEAQISLEHDGVPLIVCAEDLPDGSFDDVLRLSRKAAGKIPVVVFSRLADWNKYLKIVAAGAFDYVLYPSVRGELERVVRNALHYAPRERVLSASVN